jgi:hypothetical protein
MAEGISSYTATAVLNAIGNNTSFAVATAYLQLHTGAPGSAGTANVATETTRKAVSFGVASAGAIANDVAVTWTGIAGSQDATHWSLFDASSAGNFLGSGTITASAYTAGDTLTFAIGDIDLAFTTAS